MSGYVARLHRETHGYNTDTRDKTIQEQTLVIANQNKQISAYEIDISTKDAKIQNLTADNKFADILIYILLLVILILVGIIVYYKGKYALAKAASLLGINKENSGSENSSSEHEQQ